MQSSNVGRFDRLFGPVIRYFSRFSWHSNDQMSRDYQYKKHDDLESGLIIPRPEESIAQTPSVESLPTTGLELSLITAPSETISTREVIACYTKFVFSKENHKRIIAASLLTALGTALNFLSPYILGTVIESLGKGEKNISDLAEVETSNLLGITCLVLVYSLSQIVPNIRDQVLVPVAAHNTEKLLARITEHQLNKSLSYHINTPQSDQIYLIQKGFAVTSMGTPLLTQVAPTLLEVSIAIAAFYYQYGAPMGLGVSTMFALYTAYCAATTQPIIDARENMLKRGSEAWKTINNAITQYKSIHDFNKTDETMEIVKVAVNKAAQAEIMATGVPLKIGIGHIAIPRVGMLAAALYVGLRIQSNQFAVPEFIALFGYLNQLAASMPSMGQAMNQVFSSYPDLKFVFEKLNEQSNNIVDLYPDTELKVNRDASIQFENVSFSYSDNTLPMFNNISLTIKPGQTVALVSESGGGKSTLFNLLYGYYTPTSGKIFINNQNIAEVSRKSLKENIGLVGQNPNLFNGSVRDNIKFGAKSSDSITDEIIFKLAQDLNLAGFICALAKETEINLVAFSKGLNIDVGEDGKALSGGQQQKVAILRGFIKNTPIRLLDEVTSALDAESTNAVLKGVKKIALETHATVIVITHRLREITSADNIFVLDKGVIIAQGKHEELLRNCPLYLNLWRKQNQSKEEKNHHSVPSVTSHMGMFPDSNTAQDKSTDNSLSDSILTPKPSGFNNNE